MIDWLQKLGTPERRVKAAAWLFVVSIIAWPITALTVFRHEPQGILGLSWGAIILTALQLVVATDVRREQDE